LSYTNRNGSNVKPLSVERADGTRLTLMG